MRGILAVETVCIVIVGAILWGASCSVIHNIAWNVEALGWGCKHRRYVGRYVKNCSVVTGKDNTVCMGKLCGREVGTGVTGCGGWFSKGGKGYVVLHKCRVWDFDSVHIQRDQFWVMG